MWEKLEQIARRCAEIGELLTVPEIYGDAKELRRLTQEQKELEPVAQCYEDYRRAERTIAEATELLSDAELRDMAQEELRQAKADKERLYEELRVLLLPRDPNDGKNVIMELPYVLECGVSAAPDEIRGQVVKASIVLVPGTEGTDELKKEIQNYVKKHTAPYKYPRIVVFRDELPKTISGKIIRNQL